MSTETALATLPHGIPSVDNAQLPQLYSSAKTALAECYRVDECKEWADKAAALASYAKQAQDNSLYETAAKIHGRAIKRVGELLKDITPAHGQGGGRPSKTPQKTKEVHPSLVSPPTRKQAAQAAGLSRDQQKTATRVANVPDEEFEAMLEQSPPATVTELAQRGKKAQPKPLHYLAGRDPADFRACTAALGVVRDLQTFITRTDPMAVNRGASSKERQRLIADIPVVLGWFAELASILEKRGE